MNANEMINRAKAIALEGRCKDSKHYVCPWCGYENIDGGWEFFPEESGEATCIKCDRNFSVERRIIVTYSTKRIGEQTPTEEDNSDG